MSRKQRADQQACPKTIHALDTCAAAERTRLLAWLRQCAIDTITARRDLNIPMPGKRIKELRLAGLPVNTHRITLTDESGRTHFGIALYHLSSGVTVND